MSVYIYTYIFQLYIYLHKGQEKTAGFSVTLPSSGVKIIESLLPTPNPNLFSESLQRTFPHSARLPSFLEGGRLTLISPLPPLAASLSASQNVVSPGQKEKEREKKCRRRKDDNRYLFLATSS